jgi:hypothetical protein
MNMNRTTILAACFVAISLAVGCARTNVDDRERTLANEAIAEPTQIVVYDFASTLPPITPDSAIAGLYRERTPRTPEEVALGRRLGARVSAHLIDELVEEGIPATAAMTGIVPVPGEAVLYGEFVSIDEGSRVKRMLVGFGAGSAELKTLVEGYIVTASRLVPLGSAEVETSGGRMPGMLVSLGAGAAVGTLATSAAIGGASNVLQELGPEDMDAAAKRTAEEIAELVIDAYEERGWR